jgi:hypothetical protein
MLHSLSVWEQGFSRYIRQILHVIATHFKGFLNSSYPATPQKNKIMKSKDDEVFFAELDIHYQPVHGRDRV